MPGRARPGPLRLVILQRLAAAGRDLQKREDPLSGARSSTECMVSMQTREDRRRSKRSSRNCTSSRTRLEFDNAIVADISLTYRDLSKS
jgi:hypothetical protein